MSRRVHREAGTVRADELVHPPPRLGAPVRARRPQRGSPRVHAPAPLRFAGALLAGALALVAAAPASAESGSGKALKNTAIAGTVVSYAVALFRGGPVGGCLVHGAGGPGADWGVRGQYGEDAELSFGSIGAERRPCDLAHFGGVSLDIAPVASIGYWKADSGSAYAEHAFDIAYVPMLYWRFPAGAVRFDLGFGIGPMLLSETDIGSRQKGTNFQFSDQFEAGLGSGDGKWRVAFAFRHVSNLDISSNHDAVDFKGVALSWRPWKASRSAGAARRPGRCLATRCSPHGGRRRPRRDARGAHSPRYGDGCMRGLRAAGPLAPQRYAPHYPRTIQPVAQIVTPANSVSLRKWPPCSTRPALASAPMTRPIASQRRRVATGPIRPTAMMTKPDAAWPLVNEQLCRHWSVGTSASEEVARRWPRRSPARTRAAPVLQQRVDHEP